MKLESRAGTRILAVDFANDILVTLATLHSPGGVVRRGALFFVAKRIFHTSETTTTSVETHGLREDHELLGSSANITNHLALAVIQEIDMVGDVAGPGSSFLKEIHVCSLLQCQYYYTT